MEVLLLGSVFGFTSLWNKGRKVTIFEDNEGAIQLTNQRLSPWSSKHIHVGYHFGGDEIREGSNLCVVHAG